MSGDEPTEPGTQPPAQPAQDEPIAFDKRPTKPLAPLHLTMELELGDADAVAMFLEAVARSVREKRRIKLVVE